MRLRGWRTASRRASASGPDDHANEDRCGTPTLAVSGVDVKSVTGPAASVVREGGRERGVVRRNMERMQ